MLGLLLAAVLTGPGPEEGLVLDVGVALTMEDRRVLHNARILVRDGRIEAVGRQAELEAPEGWQRLAFPRSWAFPGGVDLHSHVHTGGWNDINDMVHPVNAELRTLDTIVPWNDAFQRAVAGGVTTVNSIPGSGTNLSGAGTLVKLKPVRSVAEAVLRFPGSVKVAQGYNPERIGDLGGTRMGMWWMLRWYLHRAERVAAGEDPGSRIELEYLAGIFEGRHPFLVHTAGGRDTFGTVRMFALEAGVPVVVSHASFDGWKTGPALARTGASLNVGPRGFDARWPGDGSIRGLVAAYEAAGSRDLSVQTDSPVVDQEDFFYQATMAERLGASCWTALESLNAAPARQILAGDRIGRLAPGLDADIVVKAGQPLDPRTPVQLVLVDGEVAYDRCAGARY